MNDYYKITADLYNHQCNFLGYRVEDDFSDCLEIKKMLDREKDLISSPKECKKNYYSLFNMVAAGFFFIGKHTMLTKRNSFFQNMNIPKQHWDDIQVDYIFYPLKEKYNL